MLGALPRFNEGWAFPAGSRTSGADNHLGKASAVSVLNLMLLLRAKLVTDVSMVKLD